MPAGTGARRRFDRLYREHRSARYDSFDVALRHQKQAVVLEADHFGFEQRAVGQRHRARTADRQLEADGFHHQAGHARDSSRDLQRFAHGDQILAIMYVCLPVTGMGWNRGIHGVMAQGASQSDSLLSEAAMRRQRVALPASI
jgi:hypothetical protein